MDKLRGDIDIKLFDGDKTKTIIRLDRKISVVRGESSVGKSYLCEMIRNIGMGTIEELGNTKLNIYSPIYSDGVDWVKYIKDKSNCIIVLDEDFSEAYSKNFINAINKSNNIFLLILRDIPKLLTFSMFNIFNMKYLDAEEFNTIIIEREIEYKITNITNTEIIVTEDSKLGYYIAKKACNDTQVIKSGGRFNIKDRIINHKNKSIVLMIDFEAFGSCYDSIKQERLNFKNILFSNTPSFEYILLKTHFYWEIIYILNNPQYYCDYGKYLSIEKFITDLLKNICKLNYINYNKNDIKLIDLYFNKLNAYRKYIAENVINTFY